MGFLSRRLGLLGLTAVAACSPTDVSSNPQGTGGVVAAAGGEPTVIPAETGGAVLEVADFARYRRGQGY